MENKSIDCPIVVDLLPLYLEGKISKESAVFVQNHLETCDSCRKECGWMQTSLMNESERGEATGRKPLKLFSVAKRKLFLYGYLLVLAIVVVYCIADFMAW